MPQRPGTMIYFDLLYDLEDYTDEETGQLIKAVLKYGLSGEIPTFTDRGMKTLWRSLQHKVDIDAKKYENKLLQTKYAAYCKKSRSEGDEPIPYEEWVNEQETDVNGSQRTDNEPLQSSNEPKLSENGSYTNGIQLPTTNNEQSSANHQSSPMSVQQSSPNSQREKKSKRDIEFEGFWQAYPKKKNKLQARKAFDRVKVPLQTLLDAIEKQKQSKQWQKNDGEFIPYPATWLNSGAWEDEVEPDKLDDKPKKSDDDYWAGFYHPTPEERAAPPWHGYKDIE